MPAELIVFAAHADAAAEIRTPTDLSEVNAHLHDAVAAVECSLHASLAIDFTGA